VFTQYGKCLFTHPGAAERQVGLDIAMVVRSAGDDPPFPLPDFNPAFMCLRWEPGIVSFDAVEVHAEQIDQYFTVVNEMRVSDDG